MIFKVKFLTFFSIKGIRFCRAVVAQLVEQWTENPCVDSSILSDGKENKAVFVLFGYSLFFLYKKKNNRNYRKLRKGI